MKEDLRLLHDDTMTVRQLQQSQLDVVQRQLHDMDQKLTEVMEAVAELSDGQRKIQKVRSDLLPDLAALKEQSQLNLNDALPPTQPCHVDGTEIE